MKVLVYGFFNKGNLGDQFFKEAYSCIFPDYNFTFTNEITEELLLDKDAIFFGGGSFLDGEPKIPRNIVEDLKNKKLFYIGIGAETDIHPWHKYLIKNSKLVATRSKNSLDKLKKLNENTIFCNDLVYSLSDKVKLSSKKDKSILFIPNAHMISKWNDIGWKQSSWEFFKSECAQTFEHLISNGYSIDVLSMCNNSKHKDHYAAIEIISKTNIGEIKILPNKDYNFSELSKVVSEYDLIISSRYHGLVLADITKTKSINIHHHDKLKYFSGNLNKNIDYYGCLKNNIISSINEVMIRLNCDTLININDFRILKENIDILIRN